MKIFISSKIFTRKIYQEIFNIKLISLFKNLEFMQNFIIIKILKQSEDVCVCVRYIYITNISNLMIVLKIVNFTSLLNKQFYKFVK